MLLLSCTEQKPLNQKNWKPPLCNIKPNVSIYLNGTGNNYMGGTVVSKSNTDALFGDKTYIFDNMALFFSYQQNE